MDALSLLKQPDPGLQERERKFLPEGADARRIWALASRYLRPEHGAAEVAYSRTTYYDTPDLAYYRSCRGPVKRRLRVREYAKPGDADDPPVVLADRCYLELKCSTGDARTKNRVAVAPGDLARRLAELTDAPLAPTVATWYRRRALVDDAGLLRLTLDDRLLLCRPRPLGSSFADLGEGDVLGRGPAFVLEYKCTGVPPAWLLDALAGLREATGFSKFQLGMYAVASAWRPSAEYARAI